MQKITVKMLEGKEDITKVADAIHGLIDEALSGKMKLTKVDIAPLDDKNQEDLDAMCTLGGVMFAIFKKICTPAAYKLCVQAVKNGIKEAEEEAAKKE